MFWLLMSSACTVSTPSLSSHSLAPKGSKAELAKKLEVNKVKTADPNWQKRCAISYDVALSNKNSGEEGWREYIHGFGIYLTKRLLCIWKPHFLVVVFLPADGQNWIHSTFCFACKHIFCFYYEIVISLIQEFQLIFFSPSPVRGKWAKRSLGVWLTRVNLSDPKSECIPLNQL